MSKMSFKVSSCVANSGNRLNSPFSPNPLIPGTLSEASPNKVLYKIKL